MVDTMDYGASPDYSSMDSGPSALMIMVTLVMLAIMVFIWYQVYLLYTNALATAPAGSSAAAVWQQQIDQFSQNRMYMTILAVAFTVVFLFLVYKVM